MPWPFYYIKIESISGLVENASVECHQIPKIPSQQIGYSASFPLLEEMQCGEILIEMKLTESK